MNTSKKEKRGNSIDRIGKDFNINDLNNEKKALQTGKKSLKGYENQQNYFRQSKKNINFGNNEHKNDRFKNGKNEEKILLNFYISLDENPDKEDEKINNNNILDSQSKEKKGIKNDSIVTNEELIECSIIKIQKSDNSSFLSNKKIKEIINITKDKESNNSSIITKEKLNEYTIFQSKQSINNSSIVTQEVLTKIGIKNDSVLKNYSSQLNYNLNESKNSNNKKSNDTIKTLEYLEVKNILEKKESKNYNQSNISNNDNEDDRNLGSIINKKNIFKNNDSIVTNKELDKINRQKLGEKIIYEFMKMILKYLPKKQKKEILDKTQ